MNSTLKILLFTGIAYLLANRSTGSIGKLNAYKFTPVYHELPSGNSNGKTNISWARGLKGVYIIKEDGVIVYVGMSNSNIYKTALRHFQEWNDDRNPDRITYKNSLNRKRYTIRIIEADSRRIPLLESGLIRKYKPRDNMDRQDLFFEEQSEKVELTLEELALQTIQPPPF